MKRRWILWFLIIAFIWLVITRFTEVQKLAATLAQGQWQWVLAAAFLQLLYYIVYAALYQAAFYNVEVESSTRELLPVTFGSIFVNVMAPSGGASGAALFVDDAVRRGQSAARATAGTVLVLVADFVAFALVLIIGLVYLFRQHNLSIIEIISAILLLFMIVGLAGVLGLGLWRPRLLSRLLNWWQRIVTRVGRRIGRPALLSDDWADKHAADFSKAAQAIAAHPARLSRTLGVALAVHLVNLSSLYVLFLAFHQPIKIGPLIAGYAMGTLFLIVSPTPMGIGFVEGLMPLVFITLDVPGDIAAAVTLAFRGLNFWLPLVVGFIVLQRIKSFSGEAQTEARVWNVRVVALLTGLMGIINILSAVTPSLANRVALARQVSPLMVRHGGHLTAALAGFALLLLAGSLWRHKQTAWLLTLIVLVISIISHLLKGLDFEEALLAAGLAIWLFTLRPHFQARSDVPSIQQGVRVLIIALLFTLTYGVVGFYMLDHHFSQKFRLDIAVRQTIVMFTQFYDPGLQPLTGFGRYFAASIYIVGAVTLGYSLLMLIRPVLIRQPATTEQRARAQAIVEACGRSALARIALFNDKSYYFSPGGSVLAYVAKGRAAVVLGDPIGPLEDAAAAISGFKDYCAHNDWLPAFFQTLPDYLDDYCAAGFKALCIGNEAIVDLASFTVMGKGNKGLRSGYRRLLNLAYRAEVYEPPLRDELLEELRLVSDEWLAMRRGREKRFSLGWFDDDYIRRARVIAVHAPDQGINAFATILPEYQRNEVTIDLMRHQPRAIGGTMDFLFVSLFEWAKAAGYSSFNLGLSPLSGVGEHPQDPGVERALHYIYEHVNQFYNFKGLHEFKKKFHPEWSPRYLVYPGPASLPAIALTLNQASSGDNFVWEYLKEFFGQQFKTRPDPEVEQSTD